MIGIESVNLILSGEKQVDRVKIINLLPIQAGAILGITIHHLVGALSLGL